VERSLGGGFKWLKVSGNNGKILVVGNFDVTPQTSSVTFQHAGTWYDYLSGGTISATGAAQSITLQPGEYHVYLSLNPGSTPVIPVTSGYVKIMGNPFRQKLKLVIGSVINENVTILLTDASGRVMVKQTNSLVAGENTIDVDKSRQLASGTYILKIISGQQSKTFKVIKAQ
jgi:hypothetical protein